MFDVFIVGLIIVLSVALIICIVVDSYLDTTYREPKQPKPRGATRIRRIK